jgi:hypothetical protein
MYSHCQQELSSPVTPSTFFMPKNETSKPPAQKKLWANEIILRQQHQT